MRFPTLHDIHMFGAYLLPSGGLLSVPWGNDDKNVINCQGALYTIRGSSFKGRKRNGHTDWELIELLFLLFRFERGIKRNGVVDFRGIPLQRTQGR